jgi:hypothetical protein
MTKAKPAHLDRVVLVEDWWGRASKVIDLVNLHKQWFGDVWNKGKNSIKAKLMHKNIALKETLEGNDLQDRLLAFGHAWLLE